jgi:hypothetical protein
VADLKVTSVATLIERLKEITDPNLGPPWYRGHADVDWKLLPCYHRLKSPPPEPVLVGRFRQQANLLVEKPPALPYDFGWMFLMQHYGVPTRLLDWTESPLFALYFVVESQRRALQQKDGALWILYPQMLNSHSTREEAYIPSFDDDWLSNYSVLEYNKMKDNGILPIGAIATRNSARIQAQLGVFTISHLKKTPIEEIEDGSHCLRLVVPKEAKASIREELRTLRISRFQLFPELASVGEAIMEGLQ